MKLGIIAEDNSDVAVIKELTSRLVHPNKIGVKHFVGHGSGKLRRKCEAWANVLVRQGCAWIAVIHDLDQFDEVNLRKQLEESIAGIPARAKIVLIPVREIETWLMYDPRALGLAFNGQFNARLPANPESLRDPKKTLATIIWKFFRKEYLNTIHNERIARHLEFKRLKRARSFAPYPDFVSIVRGQLKV